MNSDEKRERPIQFSLMTLFVLITLLSVSFGLIRTAAVVDDRSVRFWSAVAADVLLVAIMSAICGRLLCDDPWSILGASIMYGFLFGIIGMFVFLMFLPYLWP
jgi:hypothetical protein